MSERKVLTKYYPPDFDPRKLTRTRNSGGPTKLPTIRLMTPFSMRCTRCGTFIPKSRKFNARKETPPGESYLGIQKFRFYIHCSGCHGEIAFKTDPKNMDYEAESGAVRNFEPWREGHVEETDEERLRRLEEEAGEVEEVDPMQDMEQKLMEAQREIAVADALDEIRASNARHERAADGIVAPAGPSAEDTAELERERQDREDEAAARDAFRKVQIASPLGRLDEEEQPVEIIQPKPAAAPAGVPSFKKTIKPKKNLSAALGIKKKAS